jgi:uncharacterized C2H2 Zn-finger protein
MKEYKCNRCIKIFNKKIDFTRHQNRKNPCKSIKEPILVIPTILNIKPTILNTKPTKIIDKSDNYCNYCNKIFSHYNSLNRHIKNSCKIKKENDNKKQIIFDTLIKDMNEIKEELNKQKEENNKLNQKILSLKKTKKIININNINNGAIVNGDINNTENIQLNAFGKENTDILNKIDMVKVLKKGFFSTVELTEQMHFNSNIPENQNIYISNMRDKFTTIFDGKNWILKSTEIVIDELYDNKKVIIEANIKDFTDSLLDTHQRALERWFETLDTDKKIANIKEEFKLLLYNNKHIPLATKK